MDDVLLDYLAYIAIIYLPVVVVKFSLLLLASFLRLLFIFPPLPFGASCRGYCPRKILIELWRVAVKFYIVDGWRPLFLVPLVFSVTLFQRLVIYFVRDNDGQLSAILMMMD